MGPGPVRALPHVRIYGSYCMYICIYVYMYICVFRDSHFLRLSFTFSILFFGDSHFQRLSFYMFNFWFSRIFGVPDPGQSLEGVPDPVKSLEIVGNCRPSPGNRGKSLGDRGESWKLCPIPNSRAVCVPLNFLISLYIILHTHTHTHPLNRYSHTRCGGSTETNIYHYACISGLCSVKG